MNGFRGVVVDHLYAHCPGRLAARATLRAEGLWATTVRGIDPHGTDVCGWCVRKYDGQAAA